MQRSSIAHAMCNWILCGRHNPKEPGPPESTDDTASSRYAIPLIMFPNFRYSRPQTSFLVPYAVVLGGRELSGVGRVGWESARVELVVPEGNISISTC
jgi:hypothetical protein